MTELDKKDWVFIIVFICFIVISIIGNAFVCFTICANRRLRTASNIFIASLAVSDLTVTATIMPLRIVEFARVSLDAYHCIWFMSSEVMASTASMMTIVSIAADRLLAVNWPYKYGDLMSRKRALLALAFLWGHSLLCAILVPFSWEELGERSITQIDGKCVITNEKIVICFLILNLYIPLAMTSCIYLRLFLLARKKDHINRNRRRCHTDRLIKKRTLTVLLIFGAYTICWLPNGILVLLSYIHPLAIFYMIQEHPKVFHWLYLILVVILPPLNSCLNPFIYGVYNSHFRHTFKNYLQRRRSSYIPKKRSRARRYLCTSETML